jgi:hypothetical protein
MHVWTLSLPERESVLKTGLWLETVQTTQSELSRRAELV